MNRLFLVCIFAVSLAGCSNKEEANLLEILTAGYADDPDIKDLKLEPSEMAECVVDKISGEIPGIPGDPRRDPYFKAYISLSVTPTSKEQILANFRQAEEALGSKQAVYEARESIGAFVVDCMENLEKNVFAKEDEQLEEGA